MLVVIVVAALLMELDLPCDCAANGLTPKTSASATLANRNVRDMMGSLKTGNKFPLSA